MPGDPGNIRIEVSPGELIDRLSILEIKTERIVEPGKRKNVAYASNLLREARERSLPESQDLSRLAAALKQVNEALWEIEDEIRACEAAQDFGPRFIELARAVYRTNDRRAETKKAIDALFGSLLTEEKSYAGY